MLNKQSQSLPVFHGCERGIMCSVEAPCFTPHPWSSTHETCLFSSAYMRAQHTESDLTRSLMGEPTYREAVEILMKVSLLNRGRGS
jgi:hypothetical protein